MRSSFVVKIGYIYRTLILATVVFTAVGCGKAGTNTVEDSISITTDALWVAYKDGQQGQWLVLANGYTNPSVREVRSYSFRVEDDDHKFALLIGCPMSSDGVAPLTLDAYYAHTNEIRFISRICAPEKTPEGAIVTGIVQDNGDHIFPKLGKQRSLFAGLWDEQIEDFRAFSAWTLKGKRFDVIAALADISEVDGSLDIQRFFIQRDMSFSYDNSVLMIDFGSPQFSFAPDKSAPKPEFDGRLADGTDLKINESMRIGVDFVSQHGQFFRLAAAVHEPTAAPISVLPYVGFPNKVATRDNPATQLSDEGHRAFAQIIDNTLKVENKHPVVRSAISMFKTPRYAIAVVPNADRAVMSFARPKEAPRNLFFSWHTENDPIYGQARMWHLTAKEHVPGNDQQVRLAVSAIVTRAWLANTNPDAVENFPIVPFDEVSELRGWFDGLQFSPTLPLAASARSVFAARNATQAVVDAILHSNTTDDVSYGDIRAYRDLPPP